MIFKERVGKYYFKLIQLAKKQGLHTDGVDMKIKVVDFHEKFGFKTVGIIKESGLNLTAGCTSVLCN
jgi:phosphinothricin acetyltransferase